MAASKSAQQILETVIQDGKNELDRASAGLAVSGFAAGLNVSFATVALAIVASLTGGVGLAAYAVYPLGFLIVILGRSQLFTENTVTPVTVVLAQSRRLPNMLRLWAIVFIFNVLGTLVFAVVAYYGKLLSSGGMEYLLEYVSSKNAYGFWTTGVKAVFGGWLVALIAWLVAASQDTISQIFFVSALSALIPAAGLTHCIAGSSAVLMGVFSGDVSVAEYLGGFMLPTTIGNIVGGLVLVTLLNYGQVAGSKVTTRLSKVTASEGADE
ncbi:formate/nitrite transporter family protein [Rubrobacter aplysinae]|uniref:formate/nitrite transporter family protein n=1 Tax=Rubrobacter aplysinae TaxID=909625 RepID=UPI00069EBB7A|nr:formate/nitrite transporter family protein [Rubrobacter aplysinae]